MAKTLEEQVDALIEVGKRLHEIQKIQEKNINSLRDAILTIATGMEKHMGLTAELADCIGALAGAPRVTKDRVN